MLWNEMNPHKNKNKDTILNTFMAEHSIMSKSCPEFSVDLSAFFDGELETEENERIENHLAECDDCRDQLDKFLAIRMAMRDRVKEGLRGRKSIFDAIKDQLEKEIRNRQMEKSPIS